MNTLFEFLKNNWFLLLITCLLIPAYNGIKSAIEHGIAKIPEQLHEQRMEEIRKENNLFLQHNEQQSAKNLQIDNYYRTISGTTIEKLFSDWMDAIADTKNISDPRKIKKMVKELMMYGSEHTVHLGSIFMQYIYQNEESTPENYTFELLYLVANLISSLKKDFTGYEVIPDDLLKIRIKDFSKPENSVKYESAKKAIETLLKSNNT